MLPMKIYVLDTNVLLYDPNALYSFGKNYVVIPSVVLDELDNFKKQNDELGRNARYISRELDKLRQVGSLHNGVMLKNGGKLKILMHNVDSPVFNIFNDNKNDNAILSVAKQFTDENHETILVSKDILVRVKSDILKIKSEDYIQDKIDITQDSFYKGYTEVHVEDEIIDQFYKESFLQTDLDIFTHSPENHFFVLKGSNKKSAVARKVNKKLISLKYYRNNVFGITHKNVEQMMALELLLDPNVPIVTLTGKAGTGKTLLSLAAGLDQSLNDTKYSRVLAARSIIPLGRDIGYLPGEKDEKLRYWMQPIYDNLEFLFDCKSSSELDKKLAGYEDIVQVEALTYIRGRSIANQYFIIDEAQNLTPHEVKTIATRIGEGSKLVLLGDPEQIDSPYLDMYSNGLIYLIEKLKHESISGHITFRKSERSTVAQLCASLL
jgi:Predicted ATPase related to phosphate starvation-inducible protein PhoH